MRPQGTATAAVRRAAHDGPGYPPQSGRGLWKDWH